MAVQPQTPYKEYTANGSAKSFALEFDCDNQDHLIVLVDDVEPVIGTWSLSSGAVVFGDAPTSGKKITIQRNTPFRRDEDFQSHDNSFRPPGVNNGFDKIWLKLQELGVADWILSNRIDALKNYVDDRDDELRAYLMEEIRKQGVALDQLDEYYNYLMQRLAQIAVQGGWDASFVVDGDKTQKQINDLNLYTVQSSSDLRLITPIKKGHKIYLESHILDNNKGGGIFVATQKALTDNNGTVFSSPTAGIYWVRADQSNPLPEWFGTTGNDVVDDSVALTAYFTYMTAVQKEAKVIDKHRINSTITIGTSYGIDMSQGGKITVAGDFDGIVINNVNRLSRFKDIRFAVTAPTTSDKALMLFKVDAHIIGLNLDGFYVNDPVLSRTWTGRRFDTQTNSGKGIFGGSRIINTQTQGLKCATHFTNTNFFANGIYFGDSFGSYNLDDVLIDRYLVLSTFTNYQAQENVSSVVKFSNTCTSGARNKFSTVYNWDTNSPTIIFSKGTFMNRWEQAMHPSKMLDYGFDNSPVSSDLDAQDTSDNAGSLFYDIFSVKNTLTDFRRLFNNEVVNATATIKDGSGFLANGKQRHSVVLSVPAVGDYCYITNKDISGFTAHVGRGFSERYSKVLMVVYFTLTNSMVDDYGFLIGLSGIGTSDGTLFNGGVYLTCVGGNFVIVQTNNYSSTLPNATNCTVIATLGALNTKAHKFGIISNAVGTAGNQSVHFDSGWIVDHTQNITVSKSPVVANSFKTTNKTDLLVHSLQFKTLIGQGWI